MSGLSPLSGYWRTNSGHRESLGHGGLIDTLPGAPYSRRPWGYRRNDLNG